MRGIGIRDLNCSCSCQESSTAEAEDKTPIVLEVGSSGEGAAGEGGDHPPERSEVVGPVVDPVRKSSSPPAAAAAKAAAAAQARAKDQTVEDGVSKVSGTHAVSQGRGVKPNTGTNI